MEDTLFRGNREPTLDQILAEPIIQAMMRRDGVAEAALRRLVRQAAHRGPPPEAAKLRFIPPAPPASDAPPQASIGMLAQAAAAPRWPRVFPSL